MKTIHIACAIAALTTVLSLAAIAEDKQPTNELYERAKKLHQQAKELREQGKIDAAEQLEQELKAIAQKLGSVKKEGGVKEGIREGVKKESGNKEGGNKEHAKPDPKERLHHLKLAIEHLRAAGHHDLAQKLGEEFNKHAEGKPANPVNKGKVPHPETHSAQKPKGESNDTESLRRDIQELKQALQEIRAHLKARH